jgi:hypothetical protein
MPEIENPENSRMQEIEELERQLAEKKAAINIESGAGRIEKHIEISRENLSEVQSPVIATTQQTAAFADNETKKKEIQQDIRSIVNMDETRKIDTLVAIALEKGISHSIEVANSLQDPYILDTLHDKLLGELHDRLVKENKLKDL